MKFDYVWALIEVNGTPPTSNKLHQHQSSYKFYPFSHTGEIVTTDYSMWDLVEKSGSSLPGVVAHFPEPDVISQFIDGEISLTNWRLVVFSDSSEARTIDPSNPIVLSKIPERLKKRVLTEFISLGFDVIDLAGLSAITNVGYTANDLSLLSGIAIVINKYGLIATASDSQKYGEFASIAAPEHAPFFPVEVWAARNPKLE